MKKAEAVKWLAALKDNIGKTQHRDLWHYEQALDEIIQTLQQEPKWILVSERLPEEGLTVLIFTESGDIEFGQRDENKWEWLAESMSNYWTEVEGVIAWQPLPEPYEESE